jgi:hypothetical protein
MKEDLGYNSFLSNFAAHSVSMGEVQDLLENFRSWAKVRPVKTPIGISQFVFRIGPCFMRGRARAARFSLSHISMELSHLYSPSTSGCRYFRRKRSDTETK